MAKHLTRDQNKEGRRGGGMWKKGILEKGVFKQTRSLQKGMNATYVSQLLYYCNTKVSPFMYVYHPKDLK